MRPGVRRQVGAEEPPGGPRPGEAVHLRQVQDELHQPGEAGPQRK